MCGYRYKRRVWAISLGKLFFSRCEREKVCTKGGGVYKTNSRILAAAATAAAAILCSKLTQRIKKLSSSASKSQRANAHSAQDWVFVAIARRFQFRTCQLLNSCFARASCCQHQKQCCHVKHFDITQLCRILTCKQMSYSMARNHPRN
jgi:hypothetical protein